MVAENSSVWRSFGSALAILAQRMDEAEVEHLVGLVEDEEMRLGHDNGPALHQVDQAAGRGDKDVPARARSRIWTLIDWPPTTVAI
jgi:hypothetical protein